MGEVDGFNVVHGYIEGRLRTEESCCDFESNTT